MRRLFSIVLISAGVLTTAAANARELTVEITNLTNAVYFTPLLIAVHDRDTHLFQSGMAASENLQKMAEGGDISGLSTDVDTAGGIHVDDPAGGLLAPGATATSTLNAQGPRKTHLSIVAMLLPTNDGFVGLESLAIPKAHGRYVYWLSGYDAGTEANDELITGGGEPNVPGIPADPGENNGLNGTGAAGPDENPNVHIHRGVLGDTDPAGGSSDLDTTIHRWQNPVAKVVVSVR
jgi:hypothetical protein